MMFHTHRWGASHICGVNTYPPYPSLKKLAFSIKNIFKIFTFCCIWLYLQVAFWPYLWKIWYQIGLYGKVYCLKTKIFTFGSHQWGTSG